MTKKATAPCFPLGTPSARLSTTRLHTGHKQPVCEAFTRCRLPCMIYQKRARCACLWLRRAHAVNMASPLAWTGCFIQPIHHSRRTRHVFSWPDEKVGRRVVGGFVIEIWGSPDRINFRNGRRSALFVSIEHVGPPYVLHCSCCEWCTGVFSLANDE